jgi:cation:H+ antiporter
MPGWSGDVALAGAANVAAAAGLTIALLTPTAFIASAGRLARPLPIDPRIVSVDLWVMVGFTVLLLPLVFRRRTLTRSAGACLLLAYASYVAWLAGNPR